MAFIFLIILFGEVVGGNITAAIAYFIEIRSCGLADLRRQKVVALFDDTFREFFC
ncbi:hypothetical protein DB42_BN00010 [Neochlamydia sp. EPS4]|nr:hypothetical protein DB42_BN00010 [Neochlamydia sp. EPS4]